MRPREPLRSQLKYRYVYCIRTYLDELPLITIIVAILNLSHKHEHMENFGEEFIFGEGTPLFLFVFSRLHFMVRDVTGLLGRSVMSFQKETFEEHPTRLT